MSGAASFPIAGILKCQNQDMIRALVASLAASAALPAQLKTTDTGRSLAKVYVGVREANAGPRRVAATAHVGLCNTNWGQHDYVANARETGRVVPRSDPCRPRSVLAMIAFAYEAPTARKTNSISPQRFRTSANSRCTSHTLPEALASNSNFHVYQADQSTFPTASGRSGSTSALTRYHPGFPV